TVSITVFSALRGAVSLLSAIYPALLTAIGWVRGVAEELDQQCRPAPLDRACTSSTPPCPERRGVTRAREGHPQLTAS
ncbi:MAG: hypothetical protein M3Y06_08380, partial [Actinomycetota bacterium]|nr:hypothetical protein [Actinomycetota bacterium]